MIKHRLGGLVQDIEEIYENRAAIKGEAYCDALRYMHTIKQFMRVNAMMISMMSEETVNREAVAEIYEQLILQLVKMYLDANPFSEKDQRELIADCELLMNRMEAAEQSIEDGKKNPDA